MPLRVTPGTYLAQGLNSSQKISVRLAELQQQASSGVRVQKPSDDPAAISQIITQRARDNQLEVNIENIDSATSRLDQSVSQLLEVSSALVRVKEVALQAPQSLSRETLATEANALLERILGIANTQVNGEFIFAGAATSTEPFRATREPSGRISAIEYVGSDAVSRVSVGIQQSVPVNESGRSIFLQRIREATAVTGPSGLAAGTGTDTGVGVATALLSHDSTAYLGSSGVQPGTNAAAGDTVIGGVGKHVLTITDSSGTGAFGTVSLNGGPPVGFTNADTNLQVTGTSGEIVFIDTTAISAGFSAQIDLTASGRVSIDGGVSSIPIDFTANQRVTSSSDKSVSHFNTQNVSQVGESRVEYVGTSDLFQSLIQLRDDLLNTDGKSELELQASFTRRIGDVDRGREAVLGSVGRQSVELENLESLKTRAEDFQVQTKQILSNLESANLAEVILELTSQQNLLQFTYATTLRVFDQSLLNFLK